MYVIFGRQILVHTTRAVRGINITRRDRNDNETGNRRRVIFLLVGGGNERRRKVKIKKKVNEFSFKTQSFYALNNLKIYHSSPSKHTGARARAHT